MVCPRCELKMPWVVQKERRVVVRCPNRELTSWVGPEPFLHRQHGVVVYGNTDGTGCWCEVYWVDGEDTVPGWRCGAVFAVRR